MNWAYLAGFFDGEGCITRGRMKENDTFYLHRLAMSQSRERGLRLLLEIQNWLEQQGITASVKLHTRAVPNKKWQACHVLEIRRRASAVAFLMGVFPHLRIKKLEAQDLLRYLKLFPRLPSRGVLKAFAGV